MDESHFENTTARILKYCFFIVLLALACVGLWQKEAILGYFSFREFGESKIVIYSLPGTKVSVIEQSGKPRELGLVGSDGKFTIAEQGEMENIRLLVDHSYYFPEERLFEKVEKGQVLDFYANLVPLLGSISVITFPEGATVYLKDKKVGETPWKQRDIRQGTKLNVEVRMDGFITQRKQAVIEGGKEEELIFSLISSESTILLESNNAKFAYETLLIFVDGKSFSLDGQTLRFVKPGRHQIEVRAADGLKIEKSLNIKPGQTIHLQLPDWFVDDGS